MGCITVLEAINLCTVKMDSSIFTWCIIALTGLGGYDIYERLKSSKKPT